MATRRPTRTRRRAGLGAPVVAVVAAWSAGCGGEPAREAPPPTVLVATVERRDVPISAEWVGTTDGYNNAQIRARVSGYVMERAYREGAPVEAGDLLFVIDARPYEMAAAQATADLAKAEAAAVRARLDVGRYAPLAARGAVSRQELDNAIQSDKAEAAVVAAAASRLEQAKLDLEWTRVRSPIAGVAGIANAQIGDLVSPETLLATVSQIDPIKVAFSLSEREYLYFADRVREVQTEPTAPGEGRLELALADGETYAHRGKVLMADRQVDAETGTITVQCVFPNPDGLLRPGLYAKVRAVTQTKVGALLVPQRAVQELQGVHQVAVVGDGDTVSLRRVKAGARVGSRWVIDEGLAPGERIVVEGLQKVRDGTVVDARPAAADTDGTAP